MLQSHSKSERGSRHVQSATASSVSFHNAVLHSIQAGAMVKGNHVTPNPWGYTIDRYYYPYGNLSALRPGSRPDASYTVSGLLQGSYAFGIPSYNITMAYNDAVSRLNEQVRGGLDLSVSLVEASSTVRMIRAVGKFERWFKGFGPKRWANEWLEYTYGWVPLLGDIYTAAQELQRTADNKLVFNAWGSAPLPGIANRIETYEGYPFTIVSSIRNGKCGVHLRVKMKTPRSNQDIARWTSLNPASILWETLPYSFVVDWFYDVGGYLRDYETAMCYNSAFAGGFRSNLSAGNVFCEGTHVSTAPGQINTGKLTYSRQNISFTRQVLSQYPIPRPPVIKADLSWRRLVSAAALLSQQLGR